MLDVGFALFIHNIVAKIQAAHTGDIGPVPVGLPGRDTDQLKFHLRHVLQLHPAGGSRVDFPAENKAFQVFLPDFAQLCINIIGPDFHVFCTYFRFKR
ncbi:hypothetical protein D3C75_1154430 [compost metagenome]